MKKELKSLIRGELIGLNVQVIAADNPSLIGKKGEVIDETKNMLVIQSDDATSRLVKEQITIQVGDEIIPGKMISSRPEERIKLSSKKLNTIERLVKKNARKNKNKKPGK